VNKDLKMYHSEEIDDSYSRGQINLLQYVFIQQCILAKKEYNKDYLDRTANANVLIKIIPINIIEQLLEPKVEVFDDSIPWFVEVSEDKENRRLYFKFHPEILQHFRVENE